MSGHLLVVTLDGYGKRIPIADIPLRRRGAKGVKVSFAPIAAAFVVDGEGTAVIATARGKIVRVAVTEIVIRRRTVTAAGRMAKGAPVVQLVDDDRVTAVGLDLADLAVGVAQCPPPATQVPDPTSALQSGSGRE